MIINAAVVMRLKRKFFKQILPALYRLHLRG
jgi:hypothetical protein